MALLTAEFCAYDHLFLLTVQAPSLCASGVSKELLVLMLVAKRCANSLLMVSRAMELGPDVLYLFFCLKESTVKLLFTYFTV